MSRSSDGRCARVHGVKGATQTLHQMTSYEPGRDWDVPVDDPRVLHDVEGINDVNCLPWYFKRYDEPLPQVPLPRHLPVTAAPAVAVLAGTARVRHAELDLVQLSRLLHLTAGVVRTMERPYGTYLFRAAGSAGGRFPLELYVAVPRPADQWAARAERPAVGRAPATMGGGLPAGVHWYHPLDHALVQVGPPPRSGAPALIVTGVPWRTGWRYRERGYRHMHWDAGTMLAQLLALADSAGLTAELQTVFPDAEVASLVGADRVHEMPVAVVTMGDAVPALEATGAAAAGRVDAAPVEFPLVTAAQQAGERGNLGPPWARGGPVDVPIHDTAPVESVVLARGSTRLMDPRRGLPESFLRTAMSIALRGIDLPHRLAVHAVDGLSPGIYRWPDLSEPARFGALRGDLYRVCLDQGLGRDAAFVVITTAHVNQLDDREYREAHLAAGVVEGRLHLLVFALGASASGMTFIDSEVPALLDEPLDALLFTCVGVPEYPSAAGGPPGAPTAVRRVEPRIEDD